MFGNGNARNGYALFILVLFALLAVAGRIIFPSPLKIVQADNWVVMIDGHGVDQPCYYTLDELQKMTAGRVEKRIYDQQCGHGAPYRYRRYFDGLSLKTERGYPPHGKKYHDQFAGRLLSLI